jgi:hypothetical protein
VTDNQDCTAERWREFAVSRRGTRYEVSDLGRIRNAQTGRIFRLSTKDRDGYLRFYLQIDGAGGPRTVYKVHRLVCAAFHGPSPEGRPMALHGNGIPSDNRASNLRWGNQRENTADALMHGTARVPAARRGQTSPRAKVTDAQAREIRQRYEAGGVRQVDLGAEYGISARTVSGIVRGVRWSGIPAAVAS